MLSDPKFLDGPPLSRPALCTPSTSHRRYSSQEISPRLYCFHSASRSSESPDLYLGRKDDHIVYKTGMARHNITMPNAARASIAISPTGLSMTNPKCMSCFSFLSKEPPYSFS